MPWRCVLQHLLRCSCLGYPTLGASFSPCPAQNPSEGAQKTQLRAVDLPKTEAMLAKQGLPSSLFGLRTRKWRSGGRRIGVFAMVASRSSFDVALRGPQLMSMKSFECGICALFVVLRAGQSVDSKAIVKYCLWFLGVARMKVVRSFCSRASKMQPASNGINCGSK